MKLGIILSQADPETVWNAFRFANLSLERGHSVKIFLIGKGVEYEDIKDAKFDVRKQSEKYLAGKGKIYACGTCMDSRNKKGSAACPLNGINEMMDIVEESDKVVSF